MILCGSPGKGNAVHGIWVFAELAAFRMIFGGLVFVYRVTDSFWVKFGALRFRTLFSSAGFAGVCGSGSTLLFAAVL